MRNICYLQDVRSDGPPHSYPIGGLCYYLTPPRTSLQVIQDPIYVVVYTLFTIRSCALFSRIWIFFFKRTAVDVSFGLTLCTLYIVKVKNKHTTILSRKFMLNNDQVGITITSWISISKNLSFFSKYVCYFLIGVVINTKNLTLVQHHIL